METNDKEKKQPQEQTPIIDGDARPDINLDPEEKPKPDIVPIKDKGKTTHNRVDTNDLENFRDSR